MNTGPTNIAMNFNVADVGALYDAAFKAYLATGGGTEEAAIKFLGTRDAPKLEQCLAEVLCDRDKEGLFEPVY